MVQRAGARHQFGVAQHRGQGRAQIVRNGVNKIILDALQFLEVRNILQGDGGADLRDGRVARHEHASVGHVDLVNFRVSHTG